MFIGHMAIGFAAKRFAPRASLGALIAAPVLADLLWPVFLLLGWEQVRIVPGITKVTPLDLVNLSWSHSLVMLCVWATLFALGYFIWTRYRAGAIAIWLGVVSHWLLDWITHRPDMPLYPGGARYGLELWNHPLATFIVEATMFTIGLWLYVRTTKPTDRIGRYVFWAYAGLLALAYTGDMVTHTPPHGGLALPITALVLGLIQLPWVWWFDRHRRVQA